MPAKLQQLEDSDDELDLDGPVTSNFLAGDQTQLSTRELTLNEKPQTESLFSLAGVAAFILACSLAHFLLVTQGFMGKAGIQKADAIAEWIQKFFAKYSIHDNR